jgi:hypothetical protein
MRQGVGAYIRKGYGGKSGAAVRRFGGTIATAGALYNALAPAGDRRSGEPGADFDPALLAGKSAREIAIALIEAVRPVDGTQDAEASRMALNEALAELLEKFPNADLLSLSDEERKFVIERYVAQDVFRRFHLDIGKSVLDKAPTTTVGAARLKQIREYVREVIAASFRKLFDSGAALTNGKVAQIVRNALSDAVEVFEIEPA